ncbi:hypothetical protein M0R45_000086 [Rubus argutus]|uniref:Uncharacterized protein n=1 Tax=Rubus argutus TaxID=59490 RepID=A0AAW1VS03_RUBAR
MAAATVASPAVEPVKPHHDVKLFNRWSFDDIQDRKRKPKSKGLLRSSALMTNRSISSPTYTDTGNADLEF